MVPDQFIAAVTRARRSCDYATADELIRRQQDEHPDSPDPYVEAGHIAFDRGRFDLAAKYLDQALQRDPADDRALGWKVGLLSKASRYAEAIELAESLLVTNPRRAAVRVALGRTMQAMGDKEQALAEYEAVLRDHPDHLDAMEWRINVLGMLHGYEVAVVAAEEAIARQPNALELYVAAYVYATGRDEQEKAQEVLDRAIGLHPACVPPLNLRINWLIASNRFDDAVKRADEALTLAPAAGLLHVARGRALYRQDKIAEAAKSFECATDLEPHLHLGPTWLGRALRKLDRDEEADLVIEQALHRMPENITLLIDNSGTKNRINDHTGALDLAVRAVRLSPANTNAICNHIQALVALHRYAEAEQAARDALERRPNDARLVRKLASVYMTLDRDEESLTSYQRVHELDPTPRNAVDVANALCWLNRSQEAESLLTSAIQADDRSAQLYTGLGSVRKYRRDLKGSVEAYRRAVELEPLNVTAHIGVIGTLRSARDFPGAEDAVRVAIENLPAHARVRVQHAQLLNDMNRPAEAERVLRTASDECDTKWPIRVQLLENLSRSGRFTEALTEVDKMLATDVYDDTARWWKVDLLGDAHRYDEALSYSQQAVLRNPGNIQLRIQFAWLLHDTGQVERALAEFETVCAQRPTIWAVRSRARCLGSLNRFDEAETVLTDAIRRAPNYGTLRYELAWIYWKRAMYKEAMAECDRARDMEIGPVACVANHVLMLRRLNRWEDAKTILDTEIERYPDSSKLLAEMGQLCDDQNQYAEAIEWFDRALEINPRRRATRVAKSATLRSLGRFDEAEKQLAPALERFPKASELLIERGWILRDRGQLSRARQAFAEVVECAPSPIVRADARRCMAWVAFSGNNYEEAKELFDAVLAANPHSPDAKLGLAWTLVRLNDPESETIAEQLCLQVQQADPRNHLAHTCLGVLYARQRDFQLAEFHLRQSLELDPFDGSFVDLAALYIDLERFDEAEELLLRAVERNWYDIQARIELGRLYLQRDIDSGEVGEDARRAGTHFRQAMTLDPENHAAATGLAVTLSRFPGDLTEAERILRRVLGRAEQDRNRWPLLLTMARLLIERGDATQRPELYLEALTQAQQAIDLAQHEAEPYFVAGIAAFKASSQNTDVRLVSLHRRQADRYLRRCLERDRRHEDARRALTLAEQSAAIARKSLAGGRVLIVLMGILLIGLWAGFFFTSKVDVVVFGTMTPVLAGLFALGFFFPLLVRLKLPGGVEADLAASLTQVSAGPTGELSVGRGRFAGSLVENHFDGLSSLNAGPRGELPRLGAQSDDPLM